MDYERVKRFNKQKNKPLFKYLPSCHLEKVFNEGQILCRNLTYFKKYEDGKKRGDKIDGGILNNPKKGFVVDNTSQGNTFNAPYTYNSIEADNVFVFCLSKKHDKTLYKEFESDCCIEIINVQEFTRRLGKALKFMEFDYDNIKYYDTNNDSHYNMITPNMIPFYKDEYFIIQDEYRYWFSEVPLSTQIQVNLEPYDENKINTASGTKKEQTTTIGSLKDIAKVHWLKDLK